ncbi:ChaN family lipoprotein [Marinobacter halotolerans]|uniref:ChaN family lipoprotein n=1 Tax=Marinobacter halotolerans TaxID=1569211 RepID=UPI001CDA2E88|nr:ChaN family lipoprotein [Marinobacter halotolerans]
MPPQSQYDSIITDSDGSLLSVNGLANALATADVVVIGEYHGHHGAHLLQSLVRSALYQQRPQQVLTMEQFTLEDQRELDRYLGGQTGEEELIADTDAWSNYKASYRPLVEFSKNRNIPVVAANAPADVVRCVGRRGEAWLDQLEPAQRARLPDEPFVDTPAYRDKFFRIMGHGHGISDDQSRDSQRLENSYKAQLLRDNTMADQVIEALADNPGHQVIHLTGTFHAEDRLGMVAVLEKKRPDLEVAVISPVLWDADDSLQSLLGANRGKGDFLYFLQPLPEPYKNSERQREAMMKQFREASEISCD